jgi:MFS family permease
VASSGQPMPAASSHEHRFESLAVFATVVRSPSLLRVQFALLVFSMAEIASWIAILVYAYDRGGATESGIVAFAQLAPAVVFAPIGAAMGDRIPRIRMLALAHVAFAAATLLGAALLLADVDALLVYGAAILAGLALTLVRPAHAAVLPTIARTPSELTAANVATGTVENVGVLVGSVAGGLLLAETGAAGVWLVAGIGLVLGFLAVVGMHPAIVVRRQRLELTLDEEGPGPAIPVPAAVDAARAAEVAVVASPRGGGAVIHEILAGLRIIHGEPNLRVVVLVLGLSMMLVGVLDVLGVVLALDVLDAGEQGVGLISGALGAGGLLGAGIAISLVGRHHLLLPMVMAAVVIGLGIGASGLVPVLAVALLGFLAGGIGKSVFDVAGRTMLQRVAPDETLARIFGVLEGVNMAALALGTLAAPLLVRLLGSTGALVVAASIVPAAVIVLRAYLARADASGVVHEEELGLIRAIPMFAPLRVTALERLAQELDHMHVRTGADVVRQGDTGDRFFIIGEGQCAILVDGRAVNVIGPGSGFGEIALLNDVPRTATVRALSELDLFVLGRGPFLEAVTGQPRSRAAAQAVIDGHLDMNRDAD